MSGVTHATIAVAALFGEQENMVLVGHSYAGMIITSVAEKDGKVDKLFRYAGRLFSRNGGGSGRFAATGGPRRSSGRST
jgi:hypothetical protein